MAELFPHEDSRRNSGTRHLAPCTANAPEPGVRAVADMESRPEDIGLLRVKCAHCGSLMDVAQDAQRVQCGRCGRRFDITPEARAAAEPTVVTGPLDKSVLPDRSASAPTQFADEDPRQPADGAPGELSEQRTQLSAPPGEAQPPLALEGEGAAEPEDAGLEQLRQQLAGTYEEIEFLSRGGMGAVYKAKQLSPPRTVALKLMLAGAFASERHKKRFEREVQAVATLHHPAIVPIYEVGEASGQPYFTMEFIEGLDLLTHVRTHGLGRKEICELMLEVCEAIDYAHTHGIIHRDLKPGNIMVDVSGRCRILDFGLARIARQDEGALPGVEPAAMSMLTLSGDLMGTPRYMSPEQALAKPKEIDGRTDIYSIGVIFYELVVGVLPYNIEFAQGMQALEILTKAEPTRPSDIQPFLPMDLEAILLKALEKDKNSRYRTAKAMGQDIESFLADKPVSAQAATGTYRFKKLLWRNRKVVLPVLASLFIFAIVTAVLVGLWLSSSSGKTLLSKELEEWAGGLKNIRPKVLKLAGQGKWFEAKARAENAEELKPDEIGIKGLAREVFKLAEKEVARRTAELDSLIRAQDYERAEKMASELSVLAPRLPFDDVADRANTKADSFAEDCWTDLEQVFEKAHVYTREASVAFLENYIARFGDGPHATEAKKAQERLRKEPDDYFLTQHFAAAQRAVASCQWEEAVRILAGARDSVAQATATDMDMWNTKFAHLRREIDLVIRHATLGRLTTLHVLRGHTRFVKSVALRPGTKPRELASASLDGTVKLWDCASGKLLKSYEHPSQVRPAVFSPDGALLATGCQDGTVHLWNLGDGTRRTWESGHSLRLQSLAFSPEGNVLLSASPDSVKLWDIAGKAAVELREFPGVHGPATISASNGQVAAAGDQEIRVWENPRSEDKPLALPCPSLPLSLAFSPDGGLLAAGYKDAFVRVWDLGTGELRRALSGHGRGVSAAAFSPDGRILASAGADRTIFLWDMAVKGSSPTVLKMLTDHERWVHSLAFSSDGRFLASGGNDMTVRLWGIPDRGQPE